MNQYNLILDASAFDRGLGNIKRWCNSNPKQKFKLQIYIPTFTINELNYLTNKFKSFNSKEALKFIETSTNNLNNDQNYDLIIEFSEILDIIPFSKVNVNDSSIVNKLPLRLKNLLKSCYYKCNLEESDVKWILVTEDPKIHEAANECNIPNCSIVDIDILLSKELNDKSFRESEKFNNLMLKNSIEKVTDDGDNVLITDFDKTVYASRGSGKLWTP
ncbi:hypothetical protein KAFR_0A06180 [Kazachstania africana CBS 2517]|uniref:PIN domain-containing protein n=1 Tax=Kazachstania africana (strain ATCC 22294 / BCRC 22015 / CBS 2517 / CECT 1963 / NBRC 1671 / NRRL Y-8276) TaxID=1071382 RepID=H2ANV3_KAZAF|nr:hypothetical protein KAFR_0A06180 [Kazachstania africana CBS 2517]CCF56053.1 hypothetical protein KAFR_0A06180 [Kazachstania africana CBS 2517]